MIPNPSSDSSHALSHWSADFGGLPEEREIVLPIKERHPRLIWMTGTLPSLDRTLPIGWHVHRFVNPHLDAVCDLLGYAPRQIEHTTADGQSEIVDYWSLNFRRAETAEGAERPTPCSLYVLAKGISDRHEMDADPQLRSGIAYGWETVLDGKKQVILRADGKPKTQMRIKFRAFVRELLPCEEQPLGFLDYMQAALSGYVCDNMLETLEAQYRSLDAHNQRLLQSGNGSDTPYWAIANPTAPAPKPRTVRSKNGQPKSIIVMRSLIPATTQEISDAFLKRHLLTSVLRDIMNQEEEVLSAWQWSREESLYLLGMKERRSHDSTIDME